MACHAVNENNMITSNPCFNKGSLCKLEPDISLLAFNENHNQKFKRLLRLITYRPIILLETEESWKYLWIQYLAMFLTWLFCHPVNSWQSRQIFGRLSKSSRDREMGWMVGFLPTKSWGLATLKIPNTEVLKHIELSFIFSFLHECTVCIMAVSQRT